MTQTTTSTYRNLIILAGACFAGALVAWFAGAADWIAPGLILGFLLMGIGVRGYPLLKGFSFTFSIFAGVALALTFPQYFVKIGDFKLSRLILPLLQIIMFGMGTALSWKDFARVAKMPKGILVGILCQFTIMPLVGLSVTKIFAFPAEIAAGIILVGSCPSGLASNVMSYLAKANLALSVSLTAVATLLAPLLTPFLMKLLGGQYIEVNALGMLWDITKIVILPIIAGLVFNHFLHGKTPWLDAAMPVVSMVGIAVIIMIITAAGRDSLMSIGPLLILATLVHNLTGYLLGYWGARAFRMSEKDCRTVALEVGMQNGGLASGLALTMGKLATVGLAPAVFGPMMNITGSSLAIWWGSKPPKEG
ncbi:MAG: bile acid:sodium symporter family protein [Lewinellaceae bacterium]|nr:bile acid:sodium symporter family protein [Lewinella sp.]MCB9281269.1 bile acid:sodium symporter family protein [Lewinellaceae bacterium]